jgi:hypothetical protein
MGPMEAATPEDEKKEKKQQADFFSSIFNIIFYFEYNNWYSLVRMNDLCERRKKSSVMIE